MSEKFEPASEEMLKFGLNHVSDALFLTDAAGNILNVNDASCTMLGYTRNELLKLKISDIDRDTTEKDYIEYFDLIREKRNFKLKSEYVRKNKSSIPVEITVNYIRKDKFEFNFAFVRDISKEIEIENKLIESENKYRNFIEQTYEGVSYLEFAKPIDINLPPEKQIKLFYKYGFISECNLSFAKMYGFSSQSEIIGKKLIEIHKTDDVPENVNSFRKLIESKYKILNIETVELDKDGNNIILLNNSIGVIRKGYLYGLWGSQIDITERKKEEIRRDAIYRISEAVHNVENLDELFKSIHGIIGKIIQAKNFYVAIFDEAMNLIRFPYFIDEFDTVTEPQIPGKGLTEYVLRTGESLLATPEKFRKLVASGDVELVGIDSVDWLGVPLKKGNKTYGVLVVQSYTKGVRYTEDDREILSYVSEQVALAIDKKYSEDALKISEAKYRNFIESSLEGVYFLQYDKPVDTKLNEDEQVRLLYETAYISECNDLFARMYGYKNKEEMINTRIKTLYGDTLNSENDNSLRRFIRNEYKEQDLETHEIDVYGNDKYFLNNVLGIVEDGFLIANWGTQIDITNRKEAEKENKYYKDLFSSAAKAEEYLLVEKEFDTGIKKMLEETGRSMKADRAYIFENIVDNKTKKVYMSLKFEWCMPGVVSQMNNKEYSEVPYDRFSQKWFDIFKNGNIVSGTVNDFSGNEKLLLQSQSVVSLIIIPVFIDNDFWGFFGIDDCREARKWKDMEISVMKTLALAIGGSLRKKKYEDTLKSNEMKLMAAFNAIPDIMFIYNKEGVFIDYYTSREDLLYLKPEKFIGKNIKDVLPGYISEEFLEKIKESFTDGKLKTIEYPLEIQGEIKYFEARLSTFDNDKILSIIRDITERKKIIEELISAKERAEEMNKVKTNFLANMSHELRTPLHGILGFAQIMMEEIENEHYRDMAVTIYKSGTRLMDTLNLILNLSKLESEKIQINIKDVKVEDVINEVFILFDVVAKEKKIYLKKKIHKSNITAKLDEKLLRDTLNNIVNNAIKFTKAGGVYIEANVKNKDLLISVKDTGIGIPKSKQEIIFNEFRQESEGLSRSFEGSGLGLTISKKYTELLGGEIVLESEVGVGSVFTLRFPDVVSGFDSSKSIEKTKPQPVTVPHIKIKELLLVENELVSSELILLYLKDLYEVDVARDGFEALTKVKAKKYDAILMDINLGEGLTGIEVTRKIRKLEQYADTPIVAVTAFAMEGDKEEFLNAGCTHYLSKPFEKSDLLYLLKNL
jgi:PAS domain S-box-containing protein